MSRVFTVAQQESALFAVRIEQLPDARRLLDCDSRDVVTCALLNRDEQPFLLPLTAGLA